MTKTIHILLLLLLSVAIPATAQIKVQAYTDTNGITIGDHVTLTISAENPGNGFVLFPAPDRPIIPKISPSSMLREMLLSAVKDSFFVLNVFDTDFISIKISLHFCFGNKKAEGTKYSRAYLIHI